MMKFKQQGLVADLMPNIKLMKASGHFMFNYYADGSTKGMHKIYCIVHLVLILMQFGFCGINLMMESDDVDELTANTITMLFFTHSIVKLVYFAVRSKLFYRTLAIWNNPNSHPLFAESNARYHQIAVKKMRVLLMAVMGTTMLTVISWTTITFIGDSVKKVTDPVTNETTFVEIPRLLVRSWYPFDPSHGMAHIFTLVFQIYWLVFTMADANLLDVLFCSWLLFACEQIQHLKNIMKPLMEFSATLDTVVPHSGELFKAGAVVDHTKDQDLPPPPTPQPQSDNMLDMDLRGIYNNRADYTTTFRATAGTTFNGGVGPNGLTQKQEMLVRSAIKYWVERHKHIVRLVTAVGDAYGVALLLHMLTTTITLTLLAYQATKSSSVMEAAYSCHWYDGSEEAKTFVQIVCQQCQKAMSISGAKFFTVSLDLFASVLGAMVTYFMVLVQLK
ncbi:Odorant receptor coreceptor [Anthophora plagiata]